MYYDFHSNNRIIILYYPQDGEDLVDEGEMLAKRAVRTLTYKKWSTHVVFSTEDGSSVLTPEYLREMMDIQNQIVLHKGMQFYQDSIGPKCPIDYDQFCWSSSDGRCQIPESPLFFFYLNYSNPYQNPSLLSEDAVQEGIKRMLVYGVYSYTSSNFSVQHPGED